MIAPSRCKPTFWLSVLSMVGIVACQPVAKPSRSEPADISGLSQAGGSTATKSDLPAAAPIRQATEVRTFILFKILQRVGFERDTFIQAADGTVEAKAIFGYQDRGNQVPLSASYQLDAQGIPLRYAAWGNTSRMSELDDVVNREDDKWFSRQRLRQPAARVEVEQPWAMASGFAPILAQDLLLRAWAKLGRPTKMTLLPEGTVTIESRGKASYDVEGRSVQLEQVSLIGLVWGREDVWIDNDGKLVAVVTRDGEFDLFEAALDGYGSLIPKLTSQAGADGVKWLSQAAKVAEKGPSGTVALVGATLIDGTGRDAVADAVVVYDGNRIVAAGRSGEVSIPEKATKVDLKGKTIIPGLWDMHAHLEQVEQGAVYLAAGVTTVRDMGNILDFITSVRDKIDAGEGLGPRILVSALVDGDGARSIGLQRIRRVEDIVPLVTELKAKGVLEVKIYSSMPANLVKPLALEAHRQGLRISGHLADGINVIEAIDSGYDSISHVTHLFEMLRWENGKRLSFEAFQQRVLAAKLDEAPLKSVIEAFARHGTVLDDTLVLYDLFNHTTEENQRNEPGIATMPAELKAMLLSGARPDAAAKLGAIFERYVALIGELHRRGVPIVAGTDISIPGHSLHRELELYVRAGFTPMAAIQAATSVPARALGQLANSGTIEVGKRADLVILADNPLSDIRHLRKIVSVIVQGKTYDPSALWNLVGFSAPTKN